MNGIWREPPEESLGLYPGLSVDDDRVTGSINIGQTRLSLWAIAWTAVVYGWERVRQEWSVDRYKYSADDFGQFLTDLLELRGEFGRLLLVLADAERRERGYRGDRIEAWWDRKRDRRRVLAQLKRCVAALEELESNTTEKEQAK